MRVNRNDKQWIKPQTQKSSDIEILGYIILKIIRHIKINQQYVSEARVKENDNLKNNQIKILESKNNQKSTILQWTTLIEH